MRCGETIQSLVGRGYEIQGRLPLSLPFSTSLSKLARAESCMVCKVTEITLEVSFYLQ